MLIRKEIKDGKKFLYIGPLRLPYRTIINLQKRELFIGPFSMEYWLDEDEGTVSFHVLGIPVKLKTGEESKKWKHYQIRDQLDNETCKRILEEELTSHLGYTPDLDEPKTYNEKILWTKLYEHNPLIRVCCDKYAVKEYVAKTISPDLVLPVLGVWNDPAEIDFDALPDAFVLKVNWSSGFNIIVRDKSKLDYEETVMQLSKWMSPHRNSYYEAFNWGYKNMTPVVYAEQYIEQVDGQVYDYKFCFANGQHLYTLIATDRANGLTKDFFDPDFNHLDVCSGDSGQANPTPEKPKCYDRMLEVARVLAEPFLFVRVDFYEVEDKIYVGEMTFYPGGGKLPLSPSSWDKEWGSKIILPDTPNFYGEEYI